MVVEGSPMDQRPYPPSPKNAPGPFYVQDGVCTCCEAPLLEAPDLMAYNEAGASCYFRRQPETPEEVERAIRTCWVSCVDCLRYSGNDPEILRRFRAIGHAHLCDVLVGGRRTETDVGLDQGVYEPPRALQPPRPDRLHPLWDRDLDG
jgi:hypothetical protein